MSKNGIFFPLDSSGTRSSSNLSKIVLNSSFNSIDQPKLAQKVLAEKNWRFNYPTHYVNLVKCCLKSPEIGVKFSKTALNLLYESVLFIRNGEEQNLSTLLSSVDYFADSTLNFDTFELKGNGRNAVTDFRFHYQGKYLNSKESMNQINLWCDKGTISEDTARSLINIQENKSKYLSRESLGSAVFICLGASSEMGPYHNLVELGATVIGVDLPNEKVFKKLIDYANTKSGTVYFPKRNSTLGANLLTELPEIVLWIKNLLKEKNLTERQIVVGSYTYLGSDLFPKITLACDFIGVALQKDFENVIFATLSSAADVFVVPKEAYDKSREAIKSRSTLIKFVNKLSMDKVLQENVFEEVLSETGDNFYVCDGLASVQGPNYALAKRIQHFRATVNHFEGKRVSSNIAPATFTDSVESKKITFYISRSVNIFKPIEVFDKDTTKALMTYLLLYDVLGYDKKQSYRHPLEVVSSNAIDCGVWRCAVKIGSGGEVAVLLYFVGRTLELLKLPSFLQMKHSSKL